MKPRGVGICVPRDVDMNNFLNVYYDFGSLVSLSRVDTS